VHCKGDPSIAKSSSCLGLNSSELAHQQLQTIFKQRIP